MLALSFIQFLKARGYLDFSWYRFGSVQRQQLSGTYIKAKVHQSMCMSAFS
jgi:hypothetical protein